MNEISKGCGLPPATAPTPRPRWMMPVIVARIIAPQWIAVSDAVSKDLLMDLLVVRPVDDSHPSVGELILEGGLRGAS